MNLGPQFPPPQGSRQVGPDVTMRGRPHALPVEGAQGQYHVFDEQGNAQGMSSKEQADRYVKRRQSQIKATATKRRQRGQ